MKLAALGLVAALAAQAPAAPAWPDTPAARVAALALIQTLNAEILASTSATAALEGWCRDHRLAADPRVVADVVTGAEVPANAEQRARLMVAGVESITHRHVRLRCGARVLSEADNWYVPGRLTADMNRQLDTTDTPFGRAVQPLQPYRRTIAMKLLWSPLPDAWELRPPDAPSAATAALVMPDALFEHRAVLYTREHLPFAEVHEVYQRQLLAFPAPPLSQ